MLFSLCTVFLLLGQALACPQHDINLHSNGMVKRNSPGRGQDWTYVDSYNWHTVNKGADTSSAVTSTRFS